MNDLSLELLKAHISLEIVRSVAPLVEKIAELEQRLAKPPPIRLVRIKDWERVRDEYGLSDITLSAMRGYYRHREHNGLADAFSKPRGRNVYLEMGLFMDWLRSKTPARPVEPEPAPIQQTERKPAQPRSRQPKEPRVITEARILPSRPRKAKGAR